MISSVPKFLSPDLETKISPSGLIALLCGLPACFSSGQAARSTFIVHDAYCNVTNISISSRSASNRLIALPVLEQLLHDGIIEGSTSRLTHRIFHLKPRSSEFSADGDRGDAQ
jgi:hypothetical protein